MTGGCLIKIMVTYRRLLLNRGGFNGRFECIYIYVQMYKTQSLFTFSVIRLSFLFAYLFTHIRIYNLDIKEN